MNEQADAYAVVIDNHPGNSTRSISKEHSRFIKYDLETGQTLICRYSDDIAKATDLGYEDFRTISVNTAGASEDDIVRAVVNATKAGFKVGDEIAGIKIQRIKQGSNDKIFVIGTDMTNRIEPFASVLEKQGYKVELFNAKYQNKSFVIDGKSYTWEEIENEFEQMRKLEYPDKELIPYDAPNALKDIQGTLMYKANQQFIQRALQEGTILDIGKTYDSHFYDMEIFNVFK
jgi:hypothetical protein